MGRERCFCQELSDLTRVQPYGRRGQVAKHQYGVEKTISTVYLSEHEDLFKMWGVDVTINITNLAIECLETSMADLFVEEV